MAGAAVDVDVEERWGEGGFREGVVGFDSSVGGGIERFDAGDVAVFEGDDGIVDDLIAAEKIPR